MKRLPRIVGFDGRAERVARPRLTHAVAASLALGSVSICLIVTLTVMSVRASVAMPRSDMTVHAPAALR